LGIQLTRLKIVFGMFFFSLLANSVPPLLPLLQTNFQLSLFESSILPMAITAFILVSNIVMGMVISFVGQKRVLILATLFSLVGFLLGYFAESFPVMLIAFSVLGFGLGTGFTGLTTIFSSLPEKLQNYGLFHGFFGLGGIIAPIHISFWLNRGYGFNTVFFVYALLFTAFLITILLSKDIKNLTYKAHKVGHKLKSFSSPFIVVGLLLLGLYAAVEVGGTTWSINFVQMRYQFDYNSAAFVLSGFWFAFTISRFLADSITKRIGVFPYLCLNLGIAMIVLFLWISGVSPYLFIPFGFTIGPVFPVVQKYINSHLAEEQKGFFIGISYAVTGVFATLIIPLMGAIGEFRIWLFYLPSLIILGILIILARILLSMLGSRT
jgi:DHA1 family quinolone resistance protein-like MFS transporter